MMYIDSMEKQLTRLHPTKSYRLKEWRYHKIVTANFFRSKGFTFSQMGHFMGVSANTARRYYYGFADHCLRADEATPREYRSWMGDDRRAVIYEGASCPINLPKRFK